jgi:hypothetical protein
MSSEGGGFFNRFTPWGRGGGAPGGHQGGGPGRGVNHPQLQGPGGGRRGVSFEDAVEYDFADDDRNLYGEDQYPLRRAFSDAEYEAHWNSISIRMAPLPRTMMPGDLCPHLKLLGMGIKVQVYTLL